MKKSTLLSLYIVLVSSFSSAYAQDNGSNQALWEGGISTIITIDEKNKEAVGSPYLFENFTAAKISATPNEVYDIRYNAYSDEIEVKVNENEIQNFNKNISNVVITFIKENLQFTSLNFINSNQGLERGYFVILTTENDKVKLFSKKEIKYYEAKPAKTGYDQDKPAEFKTMGDTYYVSINDGYARELPKKKKDLIKIFPKHETEVANFIKKNKIKTSREADIIKLINYVNSL
nr:hypothetical protein [uncultured Psychroserpens sp.]